MRKIYIFLLGVVVAGMPVRGQESGCVGLKNPISFTATGSHNELWTGYTGSKNGVASSCTLSGCSWSGTV